MSKALSELQERIILILWEKRCRFEWKKDDSRCEWIGRIPHDEWEASFPDTSFRRWTKQQRKEWSSHDNWVCELVNHSWLSALYGSLIPKKANEAERKKQQTVIARAVDRLRDRGIASCNRSRGIIELTPWGSMYGWLLSEGRMTPRLRAKKHEQRQPKYERKPHRSYTLRRSATSTSNPAYHERIIELIRKLSRWEQQAILDEVKLMVEADTKAPESTDEPVELVNG